MTSLITFLIVALLTVPRFAGCIIFLCRCVDAFGCFDLALLSAFEAAAIFNTSDGFLSQIDAA